MQSAGPPTEFYFFPPRELLTLGDPPSDNEAEMRQMADTVNEALTTFGITGSVAHIQVGPMLTTFEFTPGPGTTIAKLQRRENDLAIALNAESVLIEPLPATGRIGIVVPNSKHETIRIREIIETKQFHDNPSALAIAVGTTAAGQPFVFDLVASPHFLIAGTTGSGKSIFLHSLIISILHKARPDEVKLVLATPNNLELGPYNEIPHLAAPLIIDARAAIRALKSVLAEIARRRDRFALLGCRDVESFNNQVDRLNQRGQESENLAHHRLPRIVVVIDDFADLFTLSGHEADATLGAIARSGRAVGVHIVIATQRPSVDVVTGSIKASFATRIAFRVATKIDSQIILDASGAETLLGNGDMLFLSGGTAQRIHGAYVDDGDIQRVAEFVKSQGAPKYLSGMI
jgi:S-DNA-T family DNA segregation ATPase FtsK/SpoIIIE